MDVRAVSLRLGLGLALLTFVPGSVGLEWGRSALWLRVEWNAQLPLALRPVRGAREAIYTPHRALLAVALRFGPLNRPRAEGESVAALELRASYRAVVHPRRSTGGFYGGLGAALLPFERWQPALVAELGAHVGACCTELGPHFTVGARVDLLPLEVPEGAVRAALMLGWSSY